MKQKLFTKIALDTIYIAKSVRATLKSKKQYKYPKNMTELIWKTHTLTLLNSIRLQEGTNKQLISIKNQTLTSNKYQECTLKLEKLKNWLIMWIARKIKSSIHG